MCHGVFIYDVRIILGILDPLPPCPCPIHATYQCCHHVSGYSPPLPSADIICEWPLSTRNDITRKQLWNDSNRLVSCKSNYQASYSCIQVLLTNLSSTEYTIELRSATRSLYHTDSLYKSLPSRLHTVKLGSSCNLLQVLVLNK